MDGDVTVAVEYSTLNYKDGLARHRQVAGGAAFPHDRRHRFRRHGRESSHPAWKPGDKVILNGWGLGESHLGGYAEKARVKGDWLVRLPRA